MSDIYFILGYCLFLVFIQMMFLKFDCKGDTFIVILIVTSVISLMIIFGKAYFIIKKKCQEKNNLKVSIAGQTAKYALIPSILCIFSITVLAISFNKLNYPFSNTIGHIMYVSSANSFITNKLLNKLSSNISSESHESPISSTINVIEYMKHDHSLLFNTLESNWSDPLYATLDAKIDYFAKLGIFNNKLKLPEGKTTYAEFEDDETKKTYNTLLKIMNKKLLVGKMIWNILATILGFSLAMTNAYGYNCTL